MWVALKFIQCAANGHMNISLMLLSSDPSLCTSSPLAASSVGSSCFYVCTINGIDGTNRPMPPNIHGQLPDVPSCFSFPSPLAFRFPWLSVNCPFLPFLPSTFFSFLSLIMCGYCIVLRYNKWILFFNWNRALPHRNDLVRCKFSLVHSNK